MHAALPGLVGGVGEPQAGERLAAAGRPSHQRDGVLEEAATLLRPLGGDHRGDTEFFERIGDAEQFVAHDRDVLESAEDRAERVQDDAFGSDPGDLTHDAGDQAAEVIRAADGRVGAQVGGDIHEAPKPLRLPPGDGQPQGEVVPAELFGALLEGHEHAGLVELLDAAGEELDAEQCLAAAAAAAAPWAWR
jgi:hypothetical protein